VIQIFARRPRGASLALAALLVAVGTVPCGPARAGTPEADPAARAAPAPAVSVYQVSWGRDLSLILGAGAVATGLELASPKLVTRDCVCDPDDVAGFDRLALHHSWAALARTSDGLVGAVIVAPLLFDLVDLAGTNSWQRPFLEDTAVLAQAITTSLALGQIAKVAVQRPRPVLYRNGPADPARNARDSYVSFYSGHTSLAFAAATSYVTTFALRHPASRWRFAVAGGAAATGAAMALLRIYSGRHFPSDVLAGALAGSAIGVTIPWLHRRPRHLPMEISAWPLGAGALVGVSGRM
jgi:membrane-associated phospholipid phosphatase